MPYKQLALIYYSSIWLKHITNNNRHVVKLSVFCYAFRNIKRILYFNTIILNIFWLFGALKSRNEQKNHRLFSEGSRIQTENRINTHTFTVNTAQRMLWGWCLSVHSLSILFLLAEWSQHDGVKYTKMQEDKERKQGECRCVWRWPC